MYVCGDCGRDADGKQRQQLQGQQKGKKDRTEKVEEAKQEGCGRLRAGVVCI